MSSIFFYLIFSIGLRLFYQVKDVVPFDLYSGCAFRPAFHLFFGLPGFLHLGDDIRWLSIFANLSSPIRSTWAAHSLFLIPAQICRLSALNVRCGLYLLVISPACMDHNYPHLGG